MPSVDRKLPANDADDPVDRLVISLRSYVTRLEKPTKDTVKNDDRKAKPDFRTGHTGSTDWVLVFDCETTTTPDQKLKFGTYQLRHQGRPAERGFFYEPDALTADEIAVLKAAKANEVPSVAGEEITLLTRHEFVEQVFFGKGQKIGAQIVGFNLPFDISRLAVKHVNAERGMFGGFSFILIDDKTWPKVAVKHLSQRMSFIRCTGTEPNNNKRRNNDDDEGIEDSASVDRGFFVDVKTLAAALTSESHTLESLGELLKIPNPKLETEGHGGKLTLGKVLYAQRDTQATWECYEVLAKQFEALELVDTGLYDLYSEASLGKAYLRTMGIKPWQEVQRKFPAKAIGRILSTYYGGRSEIHIRREITPVIHFDFLSMYPTVCTLMKLWRFSIANGIKEIDDTANIKKFVSNCTPETVRQQSAWQKLNAIVRVLPQHDLFPVRAHYSDDAQATIGLNYLTSDQPMWFTLADVLVSKIVTGKTPQILEAIRFEPIERQGELKPVTVAGKFIHPAEQDFYKELILHRLALKKQQDNADDAAKLRLDSDIQAIKILANATSYGIFVELNVNDYSRPKEMIAHGVRGKATKIKSKKFEDPGRYFHPLLGTLITGAARLMLALAERQVIDQGLDWAFCDTDSIAVANSGNLSLTQFKTRALAVQRWFAALNPYGESEPILQLEKVNFPVGKERTHDNIDPPFCLTVSAKRYVLFNRETDGSALIRKASGHGLGHLRPPYDEPPRDRRERIKRIGVPLWQEDLWREVIRAADSDVPDQVRYSGLRKLDILPAASRYAATTPTLLKWFDGYNAIDSGDEKSYVEQVKPFNFLLSLEIKSKLDMAKTDMAALRDPLWHRRVPRPAAPYGDSSLGTIENAFDRDTPEFTQIPVSWLKTYARSLTRYHMHSEAKFWGGTDSERGTLRRRHVHAVAYQSIGKEADNLEEREFIGDDEDAIEHEIAREDQSRLRAFVLKTQQQLGISDRELCKLAKVSHHTMGALHGNKIIKDAALFKIVRVIETVRQAALSHTNDQDSAMQLLRDKRAELRSDPALAEFLGVSRPHVSKLLNGRRLLTNRLISQLKR